MTVKVIVSVCEDKVKFLLDPELERTLHRLRREQREAHQRDLATMQNNEEQQQGKSKMSRKGVGMGIMVGIMRLSCLYNQMIRVCC